MILSSETIKELSKSNPPLIEGCIDFDKQLQQAGIDVTLEKVYSFLGEGTVDFSNNERVIPEIEELVFDENEFIHLMPGTYKVRFNETVHLPGTVTVIARPRSTLLRMGATIATALWDPGFEGKSESMLIVMNPKGINLKKNARILQFVFVKLEKETKNLYNGVYKNIE